MKRLPKLALDIIAADIIATSVVGVKNAIDENKIGEGERHKGFYEKYLKRPADFFLASGAIVVLSPILAGTAIAVRIKLGTPIVFTQDRPGKDEKVFKLYKFRTMTDDRDDNGELLPAIDRLTQFGKKLRSTSLDELPELINIIKGDMSIVGPRPLLVKYIPLYNERQRRRHLVRPGLTGYAQANGRNSLSWEQKFDLDVEYVEKVSFCLDAKIIFQTMKSVVKREGIGGKEEIILGEFKGTDAGE